MLPVICCGPEARGARLQVMKFTSSIKAIKKDVEIGQWPKPERDNKIDKKSLYLEPS